MSLPVKASDRKKIPIYSGLFKYFPDALAAVAEVSFIGNEQHNKGEPLHWAREKSTDQEDCVGRHLLDHADGHRVDPDGGRVMAKVAWRALASLQLELESERENERMETNLDSNDWAAAKREVDHRSRTIQGPKGPNCSEGRDQTSPNRGEISRSIGANGQGYINIYDQESVPSRT